MEYTTLGATETRVSQLCFGTWRFGRETGGVVETDYLDLYYVHRWDENTPIEETLRTLTDLVREGKVHYLGASTMAAWQLIMSVVVSYRCSPPPGVAITGKQLQQTL